jgi:hypothetical protein
MALLPGSAYVVVESMHYCDVNDMGTFTGEKVDDIDDICSNARLVGAYNDIYLQDKLKYMLYNTIPEKQQSHSIA